MYTGPFPPASLWGNWIENIEVWDVDTDTQYDTGSITEIKLMLRDEYTRSIELTLLKSQGQITTTAPGLVEWNVAQSEMSMLNPKTYELIIQLIDEDNNIVPIVQGSISIVE
jgi:hypothetical protein